MAVNNNFLGGYGVCLCEGGGIQTDGCVLCGCLEKSGGEVIINKERILVIEYSITEAQWCELLVLKTS